MPGMVQQEKFSINSIHGTQIRIAIEKIKWTEGVSLHVDTSIYALYLQIKVIR